MLGTGEYMTIEHILTQLDGEIARLQNARNILAGHTPKVETAVKSAKVTPITKKKRNLSPEGRKRIQEAVRKRWAKQKKAA